MPKTSVQRFTKAQFLDGVGIWVENKVNPIREVLPQRQQLSDEEVKNVIKETGAEIIVSYLPVGSEKVTQFWAQMCLDTNYCICKLYSMHLLHQMMNGVQKVC